MRHIIPFLLFLTVSCEVLDNDISKHTQSPSSSLVSLEDVAMMLASLPLDENHLKEVHDAASSSSLNGYDEEYTIVYAKAHILTVFCYMQ